MFVWIGIVSSILIASSFTSGLMSAVLDLSAFVIILSLGIKRLNAKKKNKSHVEQQASDEIQRNQASADFKDEVKQINSVSGRIDITP